MQKNGLNTTSVAIMAGRSLTLALALSLLGCSSIQAEDKCGDIVKAVDDANTRKAIDVFTKSTEGKIKDFKVSVENCGRIQWYFFEVMRGKDIGRHWLLKYDTKTGEAEFTPGM
jgi:hypothetical protein